MRSFLFILQFSLYSLYSRQQQLYICIARSLANTHTSNALHSLSVLCVHTYRLLYYRERERANKSRDADIYIIGKEQLASQLSIESCLALCCVLYSSISIVQMLRVLYASSVLYIADAHPIVRCAGNSYISVLVLLLLLAPGYVYIIHLFIY